MKMSGFLADRSLHQSPQIYFDRVFETSPPGSELVAAQQTTIDPKPWPASTRHW